MQIQFYLKTFVLRGPVFCLTYIVDNKHKGVLFWYDSNCLAFFFPALLSKNYLKSDHKFVLDETYASTFQWIFNECDFNQIILQQRDSKFIDVYGPFFLFE